MRLRVPPTLLFGRGRLADVAAVLDELGAERPLVVTDPGVAAAGITERLLQELKSAGQEAALHRAQFFAHASKVMRSVIVDHLRSRLADKRGGGANVTLSTTALEQLPPPDVLKLDDVLQMLERADERAHQVVEMRFFGGLEMEEIAETLGVSVPTVKRDWRKARAFLFDALQA